MLNYNSPIKEIKNYSDLVIKEIGPIMKLNLRSKKREFLSIVGKTLNMILPTEANTSSSSEKLTAIWLSPDEWMIFSNNITEKDNNSYEIEKILFVPDPILVLPEMFTCEYISTFSSIVTFGPTTEYGPILTFFEILAFLSIILVLCIIFCLL